MPKRNPSPTPNPKPTNTRGVIIWQGSELGTTPVLPKHIVCMLCKAPRRLGLALTSVQDQLSSDAAKAGLQTQA